MSKEQLGSLIEQLNAATKAERLAALTAIRKLVDSGDIPQPVRGKDVNNHIHTFYSFSPYSPAKAVYRSWEAGLATTGIMDHDSISGAEEFIEAGRIMGALKSLRRLNDRRRNHNRMATPRRQPMG